MPIRFFCKRCQLMMKIGEPMAGQTVYCPQCTEPLLVPVQSDPKAESLFQYMKRKRAEEKAAKIVDSFDPAKKEHERESVSPASIPVILPPPVSATVPVAVTGEAGGDDKENVDRWIDQFWTSIPETEEDGAARSETPHTLKKVPPALPDTEESVFEKHDKEKHDKEESGKEEPAAVTVRRQQTLLLFRVWLFTVFLVGFTGGFLFHSAFSKPSNVSGTESEDALTTESGIKGNLYYRGFGGERMPDADAVVLFLPLDRPPAFQMSNEGLRPDDSGNPSANEGIPQVEEIEGLFVRTGADGSFSVPYRKAGKYIAVFISSHSKRTEKEAEPDPVTVKVLQRYFKDPKGLLGNYSFIRDEYEFTEGRYVLQLTFQ